MSTLYVVATPIGNLQDISFRAISTLKTVHKILAEDTRHAKTLLMHYGISTPLESLHEHNEREKIDKILGLLQDGQSLALISDAGTPLISDPGFILIRALRTTKDPQIKIEVIPGPCAFIAALAVAGLPTDRFRFQGFLSAKTGAKKADLDKLQRETATMIFYESTHRLENTLMLMQSTWGEDHLVVLAKELTKQHETVFYGSFKALLAWLQEDRMRLKGEFVILVSGVLPSQEDHSVLEIPLNDLIKTLLNEKISQKQILSICQNLTPVKRNQLYQKVLALSEETSV